jgi:hypothetical protein
MAKLAVLRAFGCFTLLMLVHAVGRLWVTRHRATQVYTIVLQVFKFFSWASVSSAWVCRGRGSDGRFTYGVGHVGICSIKL